MNNFRLLVCIILAGLSFGAMAQDVKLVDLDQLETRIKKGGDTTYVINFWATWCAPCVQELPNFEKLSSDHSDYPLKVLFISLDYKSQLEKSVKPFVRNKKLKNEVFLLNEPNQQLYIDRIDKEWSGSIPATMIINRKKRIRKFYEREFTYPELQRIVKF